MTKTVLLTGATGFVGHHILNSLIEQEINIRLVVRENSEQSIVDNLLIEKVISTPDLFIENTKWWENVCDGIDTIIHAAWYAEPGEYLQSSKNFECMIGTFKMVKGALNARVRRFVGIGTCFEYDLTGGLLSIETALRPLTPYAAAKASTYLALNQWLPLQGVEFVWSRLFYLYGEGEDVRRLVPYLRKKLIAGEPVELTAGNQIRDFMNVADAAKMIVNISLGNKCGAINICSGVPITIRQLAEKIADEYGRRDLLKFGTRPDNLVDPPCIIGVK